MNNLNLPNLVSAIRISLVPYFLWLVLGPEEFVWAGILLGVIGGTDWIDGQLARRLGQVTELGKFLDPLADRLAIVAAVIGGLVAGVLPAWFAIALILREAVIAVGAALVAMRAKAKLDVRWLGKAATLCLYFSISGFYVAAGTDLVIWDLFAWGFGLPGLVMYYIVGAQYIADARRIITSTGVSSGDSTTRGGQG